MPINPPIQREIVLVLSSSALISDRVSDTLSILAESGFTILEQDTRVLTESEANLLSGQPNAGPIESFINSSVLILLCSAESAYERFDSLREQLDYCYGSKNSYTALRDRTVLLPRASILDRSVLIIDPVGSLNPDVLSVVRSLLDSNEFVVLEQQQITVTEEQKMRIYGHNSIPSGVSTCLIIEKVGGLIDSQLLAGPVDIQLAQSIAPNTIRGRFGTVIGHNFLHLSASPEQAKSDLECLFPTPLSNQRTVMIIQPSARHELDSILGFIQLNGFTVISRIDQQLSKQRAEQFWLSTDPQHHFNGVQLNELAENLSSGPITGLLLSKPAAIQALNKLLVNLQARLGLSNGLYSSLNYVSSCRDVQFWFPLISHQNQTIPTQINELSAILQSKAFLTGSSIQANKSLYSVLVEGLTQLCRIKPSGDDAILWLADWMLRNNPNKPKITLPEINNNEQAANHAVHHHRALIWVLPSNPSFSLNNPHPQTQFEHSIIARYTSTHPNCELISVDELIKSSLTNESESSRIIQSSIQSGQSIPTNILLNLLQSALSKVKSSSKVIIFGFPLTMDCALEFEFKLMNPNRLIQFTGSTHNSLINQSQQDELNQVAEHYDSFKKYHPIQISEDQEELVEKFTEAIGK